MSHCEFYVEHLDGNHSVVSLWVSPDVPCCNVHTLLFKRCAWGGKKTQCAQLCSDSIAIRVNEAQTGCWQKAPAKGQRSASSVTLSVQYGP